MSNVLKTLWLICIVILGMVLLSPLGFGFDNFMRLGDGTVVWGIGIIFVVFALSKTFNYLPQKMPQQKISSIYPKIAYFFVAAKFVVSLIFCALGLDLYLKGELYASSALIIPFWLVPLYFILYGFAYQLLNLSRKNTKGLAVTLILNIVLDFLLYIFLGLYGKTGF